MGQVAIVGLGTVGGSLGMALRKALAAEKGRRAEVQVIGYDPNRKTVDEALVQGAIDRIARSLKEAVEQADIVIVAQSAPEIRETLEAIGPLLPAGCVVTDTAGSKVEVLRWAEQYLPPEVSFVGGHPILLPRRDVDWTAGIRAAQADLFQGAIYCLTPGRSAAEGAVDIARDLANIVGAEAFFLDAWEHDGLLAGLNQAPYVLVAAMLATVADSSAWRDLKLLADPTFRRLGDLLSSQPAELYQACLSNREPLLSWLDRVLAVLHEVRRELADPSSRGTYLKQVTEKALAAWEDWNRRRDERTKELEAAGMQQVQTVRETLIGMFVPRLGRLRGESRDKG